MITKNRKKIPVKIRAKVSYNSDRMCCVCKKKGDQIHHLDEDPGNNDIDNLCLLCFRCHDDASKTGGMSMKLSNEEIVLYRDEHYKDISYKRVQLKKKFEYHSNNQHPHAQESIDQMKTAILLVELEKVKLEYFNSPNQDRNLVLSKLDLFQDNINFRIAYEVFDFLTLAVNSNELTEEFASSIFRIVISQFAFPELNNEHELDQSNELAELAAQIAFVLVYDCLKYRRDFRIIEYALSIYKFLYIKSDYLDSNPVKSIVSKNYNELISILNTNRFENSKIAIEVLNAFRNDLSSSGLAFPALPDHIQSFINNQKHTNEI